MVVGALTYLVWLIEARPNVIAERSLTEIRVTLLPHATVEMVPTLLKLRHEAAEPRVRDALDETLLPLLRDFRDTDRLKERHLATLRRIAVRGHRERPDLAVAALLILAETGDRLLLGHALAWSRRHPEERVSAAAEEYARQAKRR